MAQKKDNTILYIAGAAAILYFLFMRKKGTQYKGDKASDTAYSADVTTKPRIIVDESRHAGFLQKGGLSAKGQQIPVISKTIEPIIGQNEYFKDLYQESLNACSY